MAVPWSLDPLLGPMDMMTGAGSAAGALLAAGAGGGVEATGIGEADARGCADGARGAEALGIASGFCDPPHATHRVIVAATE